ncbi:MAG: GGDEF domain-containing protein [Treponema sp.]|jgi:diguanylate cyclase (GGDEF)-like protein|nr:GGDEF domain-containing protein [Treponema sp.]
MPPLFVFFSFFTKEALESCREDILRHNVRSLFITSLLTAVVIGLFCFFPVLAEKQLDTCIAYLITAVVESCVALYASSLFRHDKYKPLLVIAGFLVFYVSLMVFGIFLGIIQSPDEHAAIVWVFFVAAQVLFVIDFWQNLILNLVMILIFSIFAVLTKPFNIWIFDIAGSIIAGMAGMVITRYMYYTLIRGMLSKRRLELERNRFQEQSIKDELTGLSNRRDYLQAVTFYISVCQHVHQTVCAIMMDVDFFKNYNDFYGHPKGDIVLRAMGKVLQALIDEERVFAARVGGEEFIVLWTENRISEAERVALKLRQKIIDLQIPHEKSLVAPYVTASLGMYILRGGSTDSIEAFYGNADAALYEAKKQGRNCIILKDSADNTLRKVEPLPLEQKPGHR